MFSIWRRGSYERLSWVGIRDDPKVSKLEARRAKDSDQRNDDFVGNRDLPRKGSVKQSDKNLAALI